MDTTEQVLDPERAIEAILFAAGYPVRYDKLSEVIGLQVKEIKKLVKYLSEQYDKRGLQLLMFPDTCQLATREEYAPYIREALGIKRGGNLSASSQEVLAIIAYNQPTTRSFVDSLRGVDSSYAVSSLLDKELIEAAGRLDAPGRPMLYVTTDKFLRVFGLNSLADLPVTSALDDLPKQEIPTAEGETGEQQEMEIDPTSQPDDTQTQ